MTIGDVLGELMGLFLVGYGIWFAGEGVKRHLNGAKDWWRPIRGKRRYPYPASGVLLGLVFVAMGLVFALHNLWANSRIMAWVGGGLFVLVLAAGIGQPRFLHPRWFADLEDRYGRKALLKLKQAAMQQEDEEWKEIAARQATFNAWVGRTMPSSRRAPGRGYKKGE